jgi:hypothetical protein
MRASLLVLLCACAGATRDPGLESTLQVDGAQYVQARAHDGDGPQIIAFSSATAQVLAGQQNRGFGGNVVPAATAIAISLEGQSGYFVVLAGGPDTSFPDQNTFSVSAAFRRDTPAGDYVVEARAVDAAGRFGARATTTVTVLAADVPPAGDLVISLSWDTNADLDLHVVTPAGDEIWSRKINSYTPPPGAIDEAAAAAGGILDFDSNSECRIDGRRIENVVWQQAAPPGEYTVRVDTFSLCSTPEAYWRVVATRAGDVVGEARGVARPSDTRFPHERGAGVTALRFAVSP